MSNVYVIGGLLFGDEGKGTTTDFLVREKNCSLVVRYNGGPQAMHHVVLPNGTVHCFSQFGSGSFFNNCKTLLSEYMVISPHTLLREGELLKMKGVEKIFENIFIDLECVIVTPLHKYLNRISETLRNNNRYGSTGMGVGITITESQNNMFTVLKVKDLLDKAILKEKLLLMINQKNNQIREIIKEYRAESPSFLDKEFLLFSNSYHKFDPKILEKANSLFIESIQQNTLDNLFDFYCSFSSFLSKNFVSGHKLIESELLQSHNIIFEGAQGALLDANHGFFPHITKSDCSASNALKLLEKVKNQENLVAPFTIIKVGILRAYGSRHGNGPFPTHSSLWEDKIKEEHNSRSEWQGEFKVGPFDITLAVYGIKIFQPDFIAITCVDKLIDGFYSGLKIQLGNGYLLNHSFNDEAKKDEVENNEMKDQKAKNEIEINENMKIENSSKLPKERDSLTIFKELDYKQEWKGGRKDLTCFLAQAKNNLKELDELEEGRNFENFVPEKFNKEIKFWVGKYLGVIEKELGLRIGIISFGSTYTDKMFC